MPTTTGSVISGSLELPVSAAHPIRIAAQVGFDQFQHRPQPLLIVALLVNLSGTVLPALWQACSWCFAKTRRSGVFRPYLGNPSREPLKLTSSASLILIANLFLSQL